MCPAVNFLRATSLHIKGHKTAGGVCVCFTLRLPMGVPVALCLANSYQTSVCISVLSTKLFPCLLVRPNSFFTPLSAIWDFSSVNCFLSFVSFWVYFVSSWFEGFIYRPGISIFQEATFMFPASPWADWSLGEVEARAWGHVARSDCLPAEMNSMPSIWER